MTAMTQTGKKPYQEFPGPTIDFSHTPVDLQARLKDANVLITGGASGIGKGCAEAFLNHGAYVTVADLDTPALSQTRQELSDLAGERFQAVTCNVTDWSAQVNLFTSAENFGPKGVIDVVIASASPGGAQMSFDAPDLTSPTDGSEAKIPPPPHVACIQVALVGMMYTSQLAVWYMARKQNSLRCYIPVCSMTAYRGLAGNPDYMGAKCGVRGLFKALRDSTANPRDGATGPALRVNMLCPGYVQTPLIAVMLDDILKTGVRLASMQSLTDGVLRMAADESIHGKSVGVGPDGCFDLRDDIPGMNGMSANDEQEWFVRRENIDRVRIGIW